MRATSHSTGRVALLSIFIILGFSSVYHVMRTRFVGRLITHPSQLPLKPNDKMRCLLTSISQINNITVCTYANYREDFYVSGDFHKGRYFHGDVVARFLNLLRRYPDMELVDIGANLGSFTLPAARLTTVVAVEPFRRTMARLAKSVQLNAVASNVTLVNNALSSRRATFKLRVDEDRNQGAHFLKKSNQTELPCAQKNDSMCVETILLDDLLPLVRNKNIVIKIDVEAHESEVFTELTASRFFSQLNVRLVFMEWAHVKTRPQPEVRALIAFFASRKYTVRNPTTYSIITSQQYHRWPYDVIFAKENIKW